MAARILWLIFILVGLVNFLPLAGVAGSVALSKLYAVDVVQADLLLLLRHRAVFFGMVGGVLLAAAFVQRLRPMATGAGLISMGSFILLYLVEHPANLALANVFRIDVGAFFLLLMACPLLYVKTGRPDKSE